MKKTFFLLVLAVAVYSAYFLLRNELFSISPLEIQAFSKFIFVYILGIVVLCLLDFSFGNVYLKIKIPSFQQTLNAVSTVVFEEMIFRALLLNTLLYLFPKVISVILASIIFGICHKKRGLNYIFIATVAGLFYSYSFLNGEIELSIAQHLTTNMIRYLIFSKEKDPLHYTTNGHGDA